MSKIPRSLSAGELIKLLDKHFSYKPVRQVGSHIRLDQISKIGNHITIPNHNPIKIGTLSSLLKEIAQQNSMSKDELVKILFN